MSRIKKNLDLDPHMDYQDEKHFIRFKRSSGRRRRNRKVLYSNHAEPEKATFLKLFQVELHENCLPVDANNLRASNNHKKVCMSPANGHYHLFPCMVRL
jgi:hypothetical protein